MTIFSLLRWEIFFAGLWRELWAQTWPVIAVVVLVGAVVLSFFVPALAFLKPFRKAMIAVAVALSIWFAGQTNGIMLQANRDKARAEVVKRKTDEAVTTSPLGDSGFVDPWNSPDN